MTEKGGELTHRVTQTHSQRHREDRETQKSRAWERVRDREMGAMGTR